MINLNQKNRVTTSGLGSKRSISDLTPLELKEWFDRDQRREEAVLKINRIIAELAEKNNNMQIRSDLLEVIAKTCKFDYAMLTEIQADGRTMETTAVFGDNHLLPKIEKITGFSLLDYRFEIDLDVALKTPATEVFTHLSDFHQPLPKAVGTAVGKLLGIKRIVAIRQMLGENYMGAVTFLTQRNDSDLELVDHLCNNHLAYTLRLLREQEKRRALRDEYMRTLEGRVAERTAELQQQLEETRRSEQQRLATEEKLREFNVQLAVAQQNAEQRLQEAETMLEGLRLLNESFNSSEILNGMLDVMRGILEFEDALLLTQQDQQPDRFVALATTEPTLNEVVWNIEDFSLRILNGQVLATDRLAGIPEWEPILAQTNLAIGSALHIPLVGAGQYGGHALLICTHPEAGFFNEKHVALGHRFSMLISQALRNANLLYRLKEERDLLEERVAERTTELQIREERITRILETALDCIIEIDKDDRIIRWNGMAERTFGWKAEEIIGQSLSETIIPHKNRAAHQEGLGHYFETGEGPVLNKRIEILALHKSGREFPIELSITPIQEQDVISFSAFARDITSRKKAEYDLKKAKEDAETAANAKSEFLANMSHEIRTPLNAIIGLTGLLLDIPHSPQKGQFLNTIRTAGDNLLTLINDILDFSKIDAGKIDLEQVTFSLTSCLDEAFEQVAPRAAEKQLQLGYFIDPTIPNYLRGDITRVRQILVNLINNGVKFTHKGSVTVKVEFASTKADFPQRHLKFSVRDTGIGISEEQQQRLFQAFSQGDASTTRKYGGTGLGLAISKKLVHLMGGEIWVESKKGEGSSFNFTLILEEDENLSQAAAAALDNRLSGYRALIVDDNETNRMLLEHHTRRWGMVPVIAGDPDSALQWVTEGETFDVVLLDMQMPSMDGMMLARKLHELDPDLPMILITSIWNPPADTKIIPLESRLYKPIKPDVLRRTIEAQLGFVSDTGALQTGFLPPIDMNENQAETSVGARLRILLAEDNAINQKVALNMLKHIGYQGDVAANGIEVLNALERQPYDVILMDVQMPEMDGVSTTAEIHKRWPEEKRPYIVALTANALVGDREKYLEAGMDDYVSKPVTIGELKEALARATEKRPPSHLFENEDPNQTGSYRLEAPTLNIATVKEAIGIDDDEAIYDLIDLFIEDSRRLITQIEWALNKDNLENASRHAHTLKGSSASIGAVKLAQIAAHLEDVKKHLETGTAVEQLEEIKREFDLICLWWDQEKAV